jgi:transcription elongation factor Elf1
MDTNTRTDKNFKNLAGFSEEILVHCPHCDKQALVSTVLGRYTVPYPTSNHKLTFTCKNCFKPIAENSWFGNLVISPLSSNCGVCGTTFKGVSRLVKKIQSKIKITCPNCKQERFYQTRCTKTYADTNQATDPYFGLQLWLQSPVDNNTFWAYNHEHLTYLKQYVGAKLRETASGGKYALAWKLPNFIKVAKNREKILKAIGRLERKPLDT